MLTILFRLIEVIERHPRAAINLLFRTGLRAFFLVMAFWPEWKIDVGAFVMADPLVWQHATVALIRGGIALVLGIIAGILAGYEPREMML